MDPGIGLESSHRDQDFWARYSVSRLYPGACPNTWMPQSHNSRPTWVICLPLTLIAPLWFPSPLSWVNCVPLALSHSESKALGLALLRASVVPCAGFRGARDRGNSQACSAVNGRKEAEAGGKVIRSRCPTRGNSNFYEHLNDNTSS